MYVLGTNMGNFYAVSESGDILAKFNGSHHWVDPNQSNPRFRVSYYFDPSIGEEKGFSQIPQKGYKRRTQNRMSGTSKVSDGTIEDIVQVNSLEEALKKITELRHREPRSL